MSILAKLAATTLTILFVSTGCSGDLSANGPTSFEDFSYQSPIQQQVGVSSWSDQSFAELDQEAALARSVEVEEYTSLCMKRQGFDYIPVDRSPFIPAYVLEDVPRYSQEWVDRYGFGLSTQLFSQSSLVSPELVGWSDDGRNIVIDDIPKDPNDAYVSALGEMDRIAFLTALFGVRDLDQHSGDDHVESAEPLGGCAGEAEGAVEAAGRFFDTFGDDMEELRERFAVDARVVEYRSGVSECVASEGYNFRSVDHETERWLDEIESSIYETPDDGRIHPSRPGQILPSLSPAQEEALLEVQLQERALARVVVDCGGGELNELVALSEVEVEIERAFLEKHGDRLSLWAAERDR